VKQVSSIADRLGGGQTDGSITGGA
jgi:hypothetical protein